MALATLLKVSYPGVGNISRVRYTAHFRLLTPRTLSIRCTQAACSGKSMILRLSNWISSPIVSWRKMGVLWMFRASRTWWRWVSQSPMGRLSELEAIIRYTNQGDDKQCLYLASNQKIHLTPPIPIDQRMVSYENLPSGSRRCCGKNGFEAFVAKAGRTSLLNYELWRVWSRRLLRGRYKKGQVARYAIDDRTSKTVCNPRRISYHSDMGASIPTSADIAALPTISFL